MHTNSSVSLVLVLLEVLANAYRKTCTCFQQRETCSWNVPPKHPTHQSSSTSLPPKMNVTLIQSLPIRGYLSSIPPSPLKWSSSIRSSTIWNSKSVLPTQLLTLPSNTIFERYLELKLLPTCLPVIISSSTNILLYRCDNTLTLNKLNPNHIKDEMIELELPPTLDAPLGLYFVKQNRCISVLADTDEPITKPKRLRTLLGHLQGIPSMQPAVDEYNKLVQSKRPKSWNDTRNFFTKEDLKATDTFQALSKDGIGSAHNVVTDERINQLQSHTSSLIDQNLTYNTALTELALVVNNLQANLSSAPPPAPAASEPKTEM